MPKVLTALLIFSLLFLFGCKSAKIESIDFSDGSYEGELNSKKEKHGKGFFRWRDGSYYNGEYHRGQRHGQGRFLWANGETYDGDYVDDQRTGKGVYRWPDGSIYEGSFFKGKRHGNGTFTSSDGIRYEGEWLNDLQHGKGKLFFPNGNEVIGTWIKGELVSSNSVPPPTSPLPMIEVEKGSPNELSNIAAKETIYLPTEKNSAPQANEIPSGESIESAPKPFSSPQAISKPPSPPPIEIVTSPPPPPPVVIQPVPEEETKPAPENSTDFSDKKAEKVWRGTASDAESQFLTELINGLDTIKERSTKQPFSGKMMIIGSNNELEGELNLLNGVLHGKEIFFDSSGKIVEENIWENGQKID